MGKALASRKSEKKSWSIRVRAKKKKTPQPVLFTWTLLKPAFNCIKQL